jgi:hypothetical protein
MKSKLIMFAIIIIFNSAFYSIDAESNNFERHARCQINTWSLDYGKTIFNEEGVSISGTNDGAFIALGSANYPDYSGIVAIKIFGNGEIIWVKTYDINDASARHIEQTMDGGFIIAGENQVGLWLIKTDDAGNEEWKTAFTDSWVSGDHPLQETHDGGYVFTCSTHNGKNTVTMLVKTDDNGIEQWRTFFGFDGDNGNSIQQTSDNGYIIAGRSKTYGTSNPYKSSVWLIKTDEYGLEEWNRTYGEGYVTRGLSVNKTSDNGFIIAGENDYNGVVTGWLIKTDTEGNEMWNRTFESYGCSIINSVIETFDNGYIATGTSGEGKLVDADLYLIKVQSDGSIDWTQKYGKDKYCEIGRCVRKTLDGGFVVIGSKQLFKIYAGLSPMFLDMWILKTDDMGNVESIRNRLS